MYDRISFFFGMPIKTLGSLGKIRVGRVTGNTHIFLALSLSREAGQLGLVPTRPLSQLGLGSIRPGQLGLFIFLMVNRDITYVLIKKFGRYDLEYAR